MKIENFALALLLAAGCATTDPEYGRFEPVGPLAEPNPAAYDSYSKAMASDPGRPTAFEWQNANKAAVAEATRPERLAAFTESPAAADALLAKIGTSYTGDPVALTQISAVTQFVMTPGRPGAAARRAIWVAALERARDGATDGYVKTFCAQQLRLCR